MTIAHKGMTRRQYLTATGAGLLAVGMGARPALALETVRQGYQTNMWGMPTYYLLRSGLLEKHGVKFEEFAVPSGNHHAADGRAPGRHGNVCRAILRNRLRRRRAPRDCDDRICRQDRACHGTQ